MKNARAVTMEFLEDCQKRCDENPVFRTLSCAVSKADLADAAYDGNRGRNLPMTFSIDLCSSTVTNQKSSGRCCTARGSCQKLRHGGDRTVSELYRILGQI